MPKEETCIVLDFLPTGYPDRRHPEPIAQAIGTTYFTLLELVPREGVTLKSEQEVYIGEGKREEVKFIRGQIPYQKLTSHARSYLQDVVDQLVAKNEQKFVEFFNKAGVVTPRLHQFQLLPGVGKKHLQDILEERRKEPFEGFEAIRERVKLFPDPHKTIVRRVLQEIEGDEKYHLFTPQPKKSRY